MISVIAPMDADRFPQFAITKRAYDAMDTPHEWLIPTRFPEIVRRNLMDRGLMRNVRILPYVWEDGFNPAHGLNMGVREARYKSVVVTCPEVRPVGDVLAQFAARAGRNVVAQVWLLDRDGERELSLVNSTHRASTPGFYFLAMYNVSDIARINGWDERFMAGHAYEDEDFGLRWVRAGLPFEVDDGIVGEHQWHPPHGELSEGANDVNFRLLQDNDARGVTYCERGLAR